MTQTAPSPTIVLANRKLDVPGLARTVSQLHARAAYYGGESYAMGKGAARLEAAIHNMTRRVEASVAEATGPYENPPRAIRPNPMRGLIAKAAVSTMNGMVVTRDAAKRASAPLADPALRRNLREVVPAMVADAVRSDLRHVDFTVRQAASEAGRRAGDLARMVTSKISHDGERLRSLLGPLAKFSQGATVLAAGGAGPERTGRVLRTLATLAIVGSVSFGVVADAHAQSRMGGGRTVVTAQAPEVSIDDLFAQSFGGAARQAPVAVPGFVPGGPSATAARPTAAPPIASSATSRPEARGPDRPIPQEFVAAGRRDVTIQVGKTDYSDIKGGPSKAFLALASAAVGAHTGDVGKARERIDSLVVMATACLRGQTPAGECTVEADGVEMDFASGVHRITLKPVAGYTYGDKPLAVETNGVLKVLAPDAMAVVQDEAQNYDLAMGRESVGFEEPIEPEASGAPRP